MPTALEFLTAAPLFLLFLLPIRCHQELFTKDVIISMLNKQNTKFINGHYLAVAHILPKIINRHHLENTHPKNDDVNNEQCLYRTCVTKKLRTLL